MAPHHFTYPKVTPVTPSGPTPAPAQDNASSGAQPPVASSSLRAA